MRPSERYSIAAGLDALRINPLRTALSTLGIVVGVASLVAVLSLGDGMEDYARRELERTTGIQTVIVSAVTTREVEGIRFPRDDYPLFTGADARDALSKVPGIAGVSVTVSGEVLFSPLAEGTRRGGQVVGALASAADFERLDILHGRFFNETEVSRSSSVAVLSHAIAAHLASPREAATLLGERVRVGRAIFRVIGILAPPEAGDESLAIVPLGSARAAMYPRERPAPSTFLLKARSVEEVPILRARIEDWLATRYGVWEGRIEVTTSRGRLDQVKTSMAIFKAVMGAIVGISLIVGGIGIMNVLLASVAERTREIGIRKAMGARKRDVGLQFLAESVAIAMVGSAAGAILGVVSAFAITGALRLALDAPFYAGLSWSSPVFAIASAMLVGLVFGTYPARYAARLSPIDAIRHE